MGPGGLSGKRGMARPALPNRSRELGCLCRGNLTQVRDTSHQHVGEHWAPAAGTPILLSAVTLYHSQVHPHRKVRRHIPAPGTVCKLMGLSP